MAEPGRQRLRIAMAVGIGIWITAAIIGPPLLNVPAPPFYAAAAVMAAWLTFVIVLTLRGISLAWVWAIARYHAGVEHLQRRRQPSGRVSCSSAMARQHS